MIAAYYKLEMLSNKLKAIHKIKIGAKIPRFDCTLYSGSYQGIKPFINPKGMFKLSLMDSNLFVKTDKKRITEFVLVGGKNLNFSSLFNEDGGNIYYGYPNGKPFLKDGRKNPLFQFRNDLYVFIIDQDFQQIELLVLPNQKGYALELTQSFLDGDFDDEVNIIKSNTKTFFNYESL